MLHPILEGELAQLRYRELLRQAEMYRLARLAQAGRPGLRARLLLRIGDILVSLGLWLKARYQAPAPAASQPASTPLRLG